MKRRRRWTAGAVFLFTLHGTACQAWRTERIAPQAVLASGQEYRVRITRMDGSQVAILEPVLVGDTLVGIRYDRPGQQEIRIVLSDVRVIERRVFSTSRTIGLGLGAVGLFAAILGAVAIACGGGGCSN